MNPVTASLAMFFFFDLNPSEGIQIHQADAVDVLLSEVNGSGASICASIFHDQSHSSTQCSGPHVKLLSSTEISQRASSSSFTLKCWADRLHKSSCIRPQQTLTAASAAPQQTLFLALLIIYIYISTIIAYIHEWKTFRRGHDYEFCVGFFFLLQGQRTLQEVYCLAKIIITTFCDSI